MRGFSIGAVLILLMATAVAAVSERGHEEPSEGAAPAAVPGGPGGCTPNLALENDEVKIWFQGLKGHIKVFNKTDNGTEHVYTYTTGAVSELDGDETVASLDLGRAYPQTSTCTVEEDEESVYVTFVVTEDVKSDNVVVGQATVTIGYTFNKTANGAKFDLFVADWPWQGDGTLAYGFRLDAGENYNIEDAENGVGFRHDDGDSAGYVEWAPNATATYEDEHMEEAIVDATVDNDGQRANVVLAFTNVTAGYTLLEYDPWVGVGDYIIVLDRLIGLGFIENALPPELQPAYGLVSDLI